MPLNLVGRTFGRLMVESQASPSISTSGRRRSQWNCLCTCGEHCVVKTDYLVQQETTSCGCLKKQRDLTGQVFNRLTVIGKAPVRGSRRMISGWLCQCECGNTTTAQTSDLERGDKKSCGCSKHEPYGHAARNAVLRRYKYQADKRGYEWQLTNDQALLLFSGTCHYCGSGSSNVERTSKFGSFIYNGIDRKDNTIGYTPANATSCCAVCNMAKKAMGHDEFIKWARRIARYQNEIAQKQTEQLKLQTISIIDLLEGDSLCGTGMTTSQIQ
jgi:hypothetical protein